MNNYFKFQTSSTIYSNPNVIYDDLNKNIITHNNYLKYLEIAYDRDYGIIIKPDFMWYTILCECLDV